MEDPLQPSQPASPSLHCSPQQGPSPCGSNGHKPPNFTWCQKNPKATLRQRSGPLSLWTELASDPGLPRPVTPTLLFQLARGLHFQDPFPTSPCHPTGLSGPCWNPGSNPHTDPTYCRHPIIMGSGSSLSPPGTLLFQNGSLTTVSMLLPQVLGSWSAYLPNSLSMLWPRWLSSSPAAGPEGAVSLQSSEALVQDLCR